MRFRNHEWIQEIGKPNVKRCRHCFIYLKVYPDKPRNKFYSKDGIGYFMIGESFPLPNCIPIKQPELQ